VFRARPKQFLQALALSTIAIAVLESFYLGDEDGLWQPVIVLLLSSVPYTLFAVSCHRLTLLRPGAVPAYGQISWTWRETRFFGWSTAVAVIALAPLLPLWAIVGALFATMIIDVASASESVARFMWLWYVSLIPFYYLVSRMSLVLPATAIDQRPTLTWAWKASRAEQGPMFVLVGLLPLVFSALGMLQRDGASIYEAFLIRLVGLVLLAFEVVTLSLVYRHLMRRRDKTAQA